MNTSNKIAVKSNAPKRNAMYCKVCADAKKPADVIASHNVKDASGKNTCPTLASQSCKYCKEIGHTVKYCKTLADKNKVANHVPNTATNTQKRVTQTALVTDTNGFSALYQDSDSEEEEPESFPALSRPLTKTKTTSRSNTIAISYASALIREKMQATAPPVVSLPMPTIPVVSLPIQVSVTPVAPQHQVPVSQMVKKSRWLDVDSSSDEEEDEEEDVTNAQVQTVCECAW